MNTKTTPTGKINKELYDIEFSKMLKKIQNQANKKKLKNKLEKL